MTINEHTDDRLDPVKSGRVAARILKDNFKHLKTWDFAVLAYNKCYVWDYVSECRSAGMMPTLEGFMNHMASKVDTLRDEIRNTPGLSEQQKEERFKILTASIKENMEYHPKFGGILEVVKQFTEDTPVG